MLKITWSLIHFILRLKNNKLANYHYFLWSIYFSLYCKFSIFDVLTVSRSYCSSAHQPTGQHVLRSYTKIKCAVLPERYEESGNVQLIEFYRELILSF